MEKLTIDELIKTERVGAHNDVALLRLNRPNALNALCKQLMNELAITLNEIDADESYKVLIITGSDKAFAAGADIKEMAQLDFKQVFHGSYFNFWDTLKNVKKPVIAAVNGFALGGGTELALMCDIVYAGDKAVFGQPEITIGTIPGLGGTQRWPRFTNKSTAMELCLTGDRFSATEALRVGLVSKVFPVADLLPETIKLADRIAKNSPIIVKTVKESVNAAYESTLSQGLEIERRLFQSTFATEDRLEGMTAFSEKRQPKWSGY